MVKHTQTIRLSVFDYIVGLALKGLRNLIRQFCSVVHRSPALPGFAGEV